MNSAEDPENNNSNTDGNEVEAGEETGDPTGPAGQNGEDASFFSELNSLFRFSGKELLICGGILLAGIAIRVIYLSFVNGYILFDYGVIDGAEYSAWGQYWLENGFVWDTVPNHMPFYAFLHYLNRAFFGSTFWSLYILQTGLGVLTGGMVYLIARRLFHPAAGYLALFFMVLHGDWILFESRPVPAVLTGFLVTGALLFLILSVRENKPLYSFGVLSSLFLLLAFLTRANVFILLPLVVIYLLLFTDWSWKHRIGSSAVLILPTVFGLWFMFVLNSGVLQKEYNRGGAVLQANSGLNFYIGNRPGANGYPDARVGYEYQNLKNLPRKQKGIKHPGRENMFFYGKGFTFIGKNPGEWFGILLKKMYYSVTSFRIPVSEPLDELAKRSYILRLNWMPFGILFSFALLGSILSLLTRDRSLIVVLFVLGFYLFMWIFSACTRYRLPVVPAVSILAGGGLFFLANAIVNRNWVSFGLSAPVVLVIALLSMAPLAGARKAQNTFLSPYFEARAHWEQNNREQALITLQNNRGKTPYQDEPQFLYRYARYTYLFYKEKEESVRSNRKLPSLTMAKMALKDCIKIVEEQNILFVKPYTLLGKMQMDSENFSGASKNFRTALEKEETKKRYLLLAEALIRLHRFKEVESLMRKALATYPDCYLCQMKRVRAFGSRKRFRKADRLLSSLIRDLEKRENKKEVLAKSYFFRGYVNERMENFSTALQYYKRTMNIDSSYRDRAKKRMKKMNERRRQSR